MHRSTIEWCRNPDGSLGWVWNPITGCLNGCPYCYARKLANTRLKERYLANKNIATGFPLAQGVLNEKATPPELNPFYPRYWPDKLHEVYTRNWQKPRGVFVCDMADLFGIGVPEAWTRRVLEYIDRCPQHRFYLLTKQPQNLVKFSPFPDNCWVGVSVTHRYDVLSATAELGEIEAKVKYISFEPLLDDVSQFMYFGTLIRRNINWVIIGSQTKPYNPPKIEWVREIVEAADRAGIAVFLKDNLKPLLCHTVNGHDVIESHNLWAFKYFKLRQEIPNEKRN